MIGNIRNAKLQPPSAKDNQISQFDQFPVLGHHFIIGGSRRQPELAYFTPSSYRNQETSKYDN
jgi:hypothetical protein